MASRNGLRIWDDTLGDPTHPLVATTRDQGGFIKVDELMGGWG